MNFKSLATATIALSMLAGTAVAQQAPAGTAPTGTAPTSQGAAAQTFASDNEKMMYEENRDTMAGFFTDDTMATLKTDKEVSDTFAAMDADSKAGMKSACQKAAEDRGSYGTVTNALCDSVMKM